MTVQRAAFSVSGSSDGVCCALCVSCTPSPPDHAIGGVGGELDFLIIRFHINVLINMDYWRSGILRGWVCLGISIITTCMGNRDGRVRCMCYSTESTYYMHSINYVIMHHIPNDVVDC